jgi:hypothetical protein
MLDVLAQRMGVSQDSGIKEGDCGIAKEASCDLSYFGLRFPISGKRPRVTLQAGVCGKI